MNAKQIVVIYHGNCADGFTAAWACRAKFGDDAEYIPANYGNDPPCVVGRDVVLVDFSYKRDVLIEMASKARSVLVLDHHKSAIEDLWPDDNFIVNMGAWRGGPLTWDRHMLNPVLDQNEGCGYARIFTVFDIERSGAGIAWDFFHPKMPRPQLVNHVEDRDLWRFALPCTREIQAAVFSYPYEFEVWDRLADSFDSFGHSSLSSEGAAIERKHHKDVAELVKVCQREMTIAGHVVPVASLPYTLTSDAGHLMAQGKPFAACYWDTPDRRVFSLRSTDDGMDVSAIAESFGGGGHARASGFQVPRDHPLAMA